MSAALGTILEKNQMRRERRLIESGEVPACPLCGHAMKRRGYRGWECLSEVDSYGAERPCVFGSKKDVEREFYASHPEARPDDFQGQILAAILDEDGEVLVELRAQRVRRGQTGLIAWPLERGIDVPTLCSDKGWVWMDWAYPFRAS